MTRSLIVSTCGTSLLTNGADAELRPVLTRTANARLEDLTRQEREQLDARLRQQRERLRHEPLAAVRRLSAELNGVLGLCHDQLDRARQDQHILLHTDTWQGGAVAELIREWMAAHGFSVTSHRVAGLSTASRECFQSGMNELLAWCDSTLPGYRAAGFRVVFNLVGGFKSIQGFLQTLGLFYADETVYIFESGEELLRIPRLPVELEAGVRSAFQDNLPIIRRLDLGVTPPPGASLVAIPETLLERLEQEVDLSVWGRLVWRRHRPELYREGPLPPPSDRIRFTEETWQRARRLPPDRVLLFNERMDDLALYLEQGQRQCPKRLDFKALKGNPCPPATHECDLWADADTQRAFGHWAGDTFQIDWIGAELH